MATSRGQIFPNNRGRPRQRCSYISILMVMDNGQFSARETETGATLMSLVSLRGLALSSYTRSNQGGNRSENTEASPGDATD